MMDTKTYWGAYEAYFSGMCKKRGSLLGVFETEKAATRAVKGKCPGIDYGGPEASNGMVDQVECVEIQGKAFPVDTGVPVGKTKRRRRVSARD